MTSFPFSPSPDVTAILNALLDIYERHEPGRSFTRAIRVRLDELDLSGYASQLNPAPRQTANEQFQTLAERGFVRLAWLPGETNHLLDTVTLLPEHAAELFPWLDRAPVAAQAAALRDLLLGEHFRFAGADWRRLAVTTPWPSSAPASPPPVHLHRSRLQPRSAGRAGSTGYRDRGDTLPRLQRPRLQRQQGLGAAEGRAGDPGPAARPRLGWADAGGGAARAGLTANPTQVLLYGPWRLVGAGGQVVMLDGFYPAVGVPAVMAGRVHHVSVDAMSD